MPEQINQTKPVDLPDQSRNPLVIILAALIILFLILFGVFYSARVLRSTREKAESELITYGNIKLKELSVWFSDELFDAGAIARNPALGRVLQSWLRSHQSTDSIAVSGFLQSFALEHSYDAIFLVSGDGNLLVSSNPATEVGPELREKIQNVGQNLGQASTDIYRSAVSGRLMIDFLARVPDLPEDFPAVLVFRFDPAVNLFPILDPVSEMVGTLEMYLARIERDSIRILTNLRYLPDPPLTRIYPVGDPDLDVARFVSLGSPLLRAVDYRGEKVMAYVNHVPGTPWLMVVKSDVIRLYRGAFVEVALLILAILLAMLLVILGSTMIFRRFRRSAVESLNRAHEEFRTVVQNVNAVVFILDGNGYFELSDGLGLKALGLEPGQVVGMSALEFYREYPAVVDALKKVLEGNPQRVELLVQGIYFDTVFTPRLDAEGRVSGVIGLATDITERYQAAEALRQRESWFRRLADTTSNAIFIYQGDQLVYVNKTCTELTGYAESELIGVNFWDFVHPDVRSQARVRGQQRQQGFDVPARSEFRLIRKDGSEVWIDYSAGLIDWEDRPAVIGTAIDITRRKKGEMIQMLQFNLSEAMVRSKSINELYSIIREELSALIDTTNLYFADYDPVTKMLSAPYEKDEHGEIPEKWPAEGSLTGFLIRSGSSLFLTEPEIRDLADQGRISLLGTVASCWLGVPIKISGEPAGALVVQNYRRTDAFDRESLRILEMVSNQLGAFMERKKAENTAAKLVKSIEQSPVSILITNDKGSIEYVNPMFCKITGYQKAEVMGKTPAILQSGEHENGIYQDLWNTILQGNDWHGEFLNRKKSGETFWESGIISPVFDDGGRITHYIAVMEDITQRKIMISDLIRAKEDAEESDRLKSAFLANMSHEIRTPMNAIIGFSELLNDEGMLPEEKRRFTEIIQKRSYDLLEIINDILDLSSLEAGALKPVIRPGKVSELLYDVHHTIKIIWIDSGKSKVGFSMQIPPEMNGLELNTDLRRLRQVLLNLINNAFKFTQQGSILLVCHMPENGLIRFDVRDTGPGIPLAKQEAIFERFVQVDDSLTRKHGGTGLGLPICKGLVGLLGGRIDVESVPGTGSMFSFTVMQRLK